jgi:hypothetical protein
MKNITCFSSQMRFMYTKTEYADQSLLDVTTLMLIRHLKIDITS